MKFASTPESGFVKELGTGELYPVTEIFYGYVEEDFERSHLTEMVFQTRDYQFTKYTTGPSAKLGSIYKLEVVHPISNETRVIYWGKEEMDENKKRFIPLTQIHYDRQHRKSVIELPTPGNLPVMRLAELPKGFLGFKGSYEYSDAVTFQANPDDYVTTTDKDVAYIKLPDGSFAKVLNNFPCKYYAFTKKGVLLGEGVTAYTESEYAEETNPKLPEGWYETSYYHYYNNEDSAMKLYINGEEWKPQSESAPHSDILVCMPQNYSAKKSSRCYNRYVFYYNPATVKVVECSEADYDYYHPQPRRKPSLVKKVDSDIVAKSTNSTNDSDNPFAMLEKLKNKFQ